MGYALGSDDLEEFAYYNWLLKEMDDIKKDLIMKRQHLTGISQKEQIDEFECFFSNRCDSYTYLSAIAVDYSQ